MLICVTFLTQNKECHQNGFAVALRRTSARIQIILISYALINITDLTVARLRIQKRSKVVAYMLIYTRPIHSLKAGQIDYAPCSAHCLLTDTFVTVTIR